jgi:hypothetical protein
LGNLVLETICTGEYKSEVDKIHDIQSKARSEFRTQHNKKFIQLSQNKSQSFGINQLTDHKKMCKRMFLNLYDEVPCCHREVHLLCLIYTLYALICILIGFFALSDLTKKPSSKL